MQGFFICLSSLLETLNNLADFVVAIIGGFCALYGISYLKTLRQKKVEATYSFEIQLYVRITELKESLDINERLLANLFSTTIRKEWGDSRAAPENQLIRFYSNCDETLKFIKSASDQMPVYANWMKDYAKLMRFLIDILNYDIRDSKSNFKFTTCDVNLTQYKNEITGIMTNILSGIMNDQDKTSKDLFPDSNSDFKEC